MISAALPSSSSSSRSPLNQTSSLFSHSTLVEPNSAFPLDGKVTAQQAVSYFTVTLKKPCLVVIRFKEGNTASRCALFLSCTCAKPDANNAAWRLISPEPIKQIVVHPADPAYRPGLLHIAIHYLEESGHSNFQLQVGLHADFFAIWLQTGGRRRDEAGTAPTDDSTSLGITRPRGNSASEQSAASEAASVPVVPTLRTLLSGSAARPLGTSSLSAGVPFTSLYVGDWCGDQREGLGFQYYSAPEEVVSQLTQIENFANGFEPDNACASDKGDGGSRSPPDSQRATTMGEMDVAQPLLLLRAFSERLNLPWSAWSIADTLTPEELAHARFGFSAHSDPSAKDDEATTGSTSERVSDSSQGTSASRSNDSLSFTRRASSRPLAHAAPYFTAADGIAALGCAINALVATEIANSDTGAWQVLPVCPGVEVYAGEWVANQKEGSGAYQWTDRSYVGEWVSGRREGYGLLRRKDGGWYRGQWERHVPHGRGEAWLTPAGQLYTGDWRDGQRHGSGSLTYANGSTVHGTFAYDELQPNVHVVYPDGSTYDGLWDPKGACRQGEGTWADVLGCKHVHEWQHDIRVGAGQEIYPNGVVLHGVWKADKLVSGTYVFPNGDRHVGALDESRYIREGTGTTVSADGAFVYTGEWHQDKRSGHGTQTVQRLPRTCQPGEPPANPTMEKYEGGWLDDMRNGQGRLTDGDVVYEGDFKHDCRDGAGVQRNTRTGSFYKGSWKANHRCGAGTYYSATQGITYEGVFLHDSLTSVGKATNTTTTEEYTGSWLDGLQQGHGSLRLPNGDVLRGVWHRGVPNTAASVEYIEAESPAKGSLRGEAAISRYVGGWLDGAREGSGTQVFHDGSVYEGKWSANKQHGRGRRTAVSGEWVECEWRDGCIVEGCTGSVHFADGSIYRGHLNVAGVPDGTGVLTYPDGTVFDGKFCDGIYQL